MIITETKNINEILKATGTAQNVFIAGCGGCAKKCGTSDDAAVNALSAELTKAGKTVTGFFICDTACDMRLLKRDILKNENFIKSDIVVMLSCGAGVQALAGLTDKKIVAALDGKFIGTTERIGITHKFCKVCGDTCALNETAGICPKTRCSKNLISGPCGGYVDGKCEADTSKDCAWVLIYKRLGKI
jgi:hypothetical protein